ncbi:hypothetical protein [Methylobacterium gossipiicola]|uniref:Uncharacterized protein n=1 Tax=Methylobacterium gossipiicola TaxID=582675 RepID=A0A1I2XD68_9HYPH|nr:hypothetical protein [Methylobacterium gossipiicola]SFH10636.1 hypothetical protein SAMN05192565_13615 [Methylobacterium gossipiicola]
MLATVIVSTVSLIALQVLLVVKAADRLSPQSGVRASDPVAAPLSTAGRFAGIA